MYTCVYVYIFVQILSFCLNVKFSDIKKARNTKQFRVYHMLIKCI